MPTFHSRMTRPQGQGVQVPQTDAGARYKGYPTAPGVVTGMQNTQGVPSLQTRTTQGLSGSHTALDDKDKMPTGTRTFFLVRHGMTVAVSLRPKIGKQPDPELSWDGTFQARLLGDQLGKGRKFCRIITSDMSRAVQTAKIVASRTNTPASVKVEMYPFLREVEPIGPDLWRVGNALLAMLEPPPPGLHVDEEVLVVLHEHVMRALLYVYMRTPMGMERDVNIGILNTGVIQVIAGRRAVYRAHPESAPWQRKWAMSNRGAQRIQFGYHSAAQTMVNEGSGEFPEGSGQVTCAVRAVLRGWNDRREVWERVWDDRHPQRVRVSRNAYREVLRAARVEEVDLVLCRLGLADAEFVYLEDLSVRFVEEAEHRLAEYMPEALDHAQSVHVAPQPLRGDQALPRTPSVSPTRDRGPSRPVGRPQTVHPLMPLFVMPR